MIYHERAYEKDKIIRRLLKMKKYREDFESKVIKTGGCHYFSTKVWNVTYKGKAYAFVPSRVMLAYLGITIPKKHVIRHIRHDICGNSDCINPKHIMTGTVAQNNADRILDGTSKGERNPQAKITEKEVKEIRNLYATGKYYNHELARIFGISLRNTVTIISNEGWQHVEYPEVVKRKTHPKAKLKEPYVVAMRKLYATGKFSQRKLAAIFGVSPTTACNAILGKEWSHAS